jgi:iron complex outermembrane recepter protein
VRGSGAVLYGAGATGGTINIITRRFAAGATRGYALGRIGGFNTKEARLGYGKLGERFGFSLDASHEDTGGYRRNNHFRQTNLAGMLEARGEQSRMFARFSAGQQALELPGALTEAQIRADRRQASTPGNESGRDNAGVVLGGAWNAGRHELASELSYRNRNASAFFLPGFFVDTHVNLWSFTPRAKLRFDALGREHDVIVGMDWERWDYDNRNAASPTTVSAPFSQRIGEQTNHAFYAQGNFWLAERTRIVLGGRVQRSEELLAERLFPVDERRANHHLEAYEAALRQGFGAGWSAYGKYGKSFRLGNFDENACFFPPCTATLLAPQTAQAAELGLEYERGPLRGRAAVYEKRLENEIYFSPLVFTNINLSPTRRRGVELEGSWRASPALEWRAALALMEAHFRSGAYGGVDVTGKKVPLVPNAILSTGVSWAFADRAKANLNARFVGKQLYDNDQANSFGRSMPTYGLVDAKIEQGFGKVVLAFEVRNLFDRNYYSYGIWDGATSFSAYPQPGRAAYLTAAYRLD